MSWRLSLAVQKRGPDTPASRAVLRILADYTKDQGVPAWPSVTTITSETALAERTVRRALRRLEAEGWIATDLGGGGRRSNRYALTPKTWNLLPGFGAVDPSPYPPSPVMVTPQPGHGDPSRGVMVTPESVRESVNESVSREGPRPHVADAPHARRRSPRTPVPEIFPTLEAQDAALAEGYAYEVIENEGSKFAFFHRARGNTRACWTSEFLLWLARDPEGGGMVGKPHGRGGGQGISIAGYVAKCRIRSEI